MSILRRVILVPLSAGLVFTFDDGTEFTFDDGTPFEFTE